MPIPWTFVEIDVGTKLAIDVIVSEVDPLVIVHTRMAPLHSPQ
jgi:hypothetical protein